MTKLSHAAQRQANGTVDEINYRFRKAGIGYEFSDGEMIRVDSQLLHKEAVLPALQVIRLPGFEGPQREFLKAHEHYRHRRNSEAIVECHKALKAL